MILISFLFFSYIFAVPQNGALIVDSIIAYAIIPMEKAAITDDTLRVDDDRASVIQPHALSQYARCDKIAQTVASDIALAKIVSIQKLIGGSVKLRLTKSADKAVDLKLLVVGIYRHDLVFPVIAASGGVKKLSYDSWGGAFQGEGMSSATSWMIVEHS